MHRRDTPLPAEYLRGSVILHDGQIVDLTAWEAMALGTRRAFVEDAKKRAMAYAQPVETEDGESADDVGAADSFDDASLCSEWETDDDKVILPLAPPREDVSDAPVRTGAALLDDTPQHTPNVSRTVGLEPVGRAMSLSSESQGDERVTDRGVRAGLLRSPPLIKRRVSAQADIRD